MSSVIHRNEVIDSLFLPIKRLLDDPSVQEIMVNKPSDENTESDIWVERNGIIEKERVEGMDQFRLRGIITALGKMSHKDVKENSSDSIVDAKMDGFRIAACLSPISVDGHSMTIRKHSLAIMDTLDYAKSISGKAIHSYSEPVVNPSDPYSINEFFKWIIENRKTFIVSGGTSSGKTSFLNAILSHIDHSNRVMVLEDTSELKFRVPNMIRMEANQQSGVNMALLLRLALRYRPDRIIVGELRGEESYDFLQAINTGHDGGACSIHANNGIGALKRLETLVLKAGTGWPFEAIRSQIASTVDYVIQLKRVNGIRGIESIIKLEDYDGKSYVTKQIV
jgi:Flp pilus assembly CpaF family ATPase